jgi:phosphatidylglycerol:prolipoprotein diacylglycerol transferase
MPHLGPVPINWYGLGAVLGFIVAAALIFCWARESVISRRQLESLLVWIAVGVLAGARLYYVVQNDPGDYFAHPWRIAAVWEGGLAFFGGLFGAILAAFLYVKRNHLSFGVVSDLFAPAIPIGAAIGRIACGLDGMDYGTPTSLPWGVVYVNRNSYAPVDLVARHPVQFYELIGDLLIAALLIRLRHRLRDGNLFLLYLVLFAILRFALFFVRGNVPVVALGLKNAQWTALAILIVSVPLLAIRGAKARE